MRTCDVTVISRGGRRWQHDALETLDLYQLHLVVLTNQLHRVRARAAAVSSCSSCRHAAAADAAVLNQLQLLRVNGLTEQLFKHLLGGGSHLLTEYAVDKHTLYVQYNVHYIKLTELLKDDSQVVRLRSGSH